MHAKIYAYGILFARLCSICVQPIFYFSFTCHSFAVYITSKCKISLGYRILSTHFVSSQQQWLRLCKFVELFEKSNFHEFLRIFWNLKKKWSNFSKTIFSSKIAKINENVFQKIDPGKRFKENRSKVRKPLTVFEIRTNR